MWAHGSSSEQVLRLGRHSFEGGGFQPRAELVIRYVMSALDGRAVGAKGEHRVCGAGARWRAYRSWRPVLAGDCRNRPSARCSRF